ncbi:MAG: hypothetical protein U0234_13425 [Sandaracinus sp.]
MRRILAASLLATSLACTPRGEGVIVVPDPPPREGTHASGDETPPLPPPVGRRPSDDETRALHALTRAAERIRGLRFAREVPVRIQSSEEITAFVESRIDERELEHARVFYVAVGLLPEGLDVRAMLLGVMGEQIVGFYDPDSGTLVIRDDVMRELRAMESAGRQVTEAASAIVIVHELVHALQDQRLALGEHFHFAPGHRERSGDEANAFASLVEGDATLAMIGWLAARGGGHLSDLTESPERLRGLVEGSDMSSGGPALAGAPPIVRAPLLSRYFDGMLFCAALHARGGFPIVDAAHRDPPTTSEQVLHPAAYFAHDAGETITIPALPGLEALGYAAHDEDTLGELELSVWLALGSAHDRDATAGAGWDGDRLRVYRREDGATAAVWWTLWDDEAEAREAEVAAQRAAAAASATVRRAGRALAIQLGVPDPARPELEAAFDAFAAALPAP